MDKCYSYGISDLFLLIALAAAKKHQINLEYSHLDSSSFSVHGEYKEVLPLLKESSEAASKKADIVKEIPIKITHGYSRDHRLLFKTIHVEYDSRVIAFILYQMYLTKQLQ